MMHQSAALYSSSLQIVRVLSERWLANQGYCPSCSRSLIAHPNNHPAADFFCSACRLDLSKDGPFGRKVVDGAYSAMMLRIASDSAPSLFLLSYKKPSYIVTGLQVIPSHFLHKGIIEPKKALSETARRAGWQGCNILLNALPSSAKIDIVVRGELVPRLQVQTAWANNAFLRHTSVSERGWLSETMRCIEALRSASFSLEDVYRFEGELSKRYPKNNNIRAKLRQQLQKLRDMGHVRFLGNGVYEVPSASPKSADIDESFGEMSHV